MNEQHVLTVPAACVRDLLGESRLYHDSRSILAIQSLVADGKYVPREAAEQDGSVMQIICCGVVYHNRRVLCIRRSKKGNRSALRLKWTLMIGGHVDQLDADSPAPVFSCLERELREEVGLRPTGESNQIGIISDFENPVGRLHLGIIYQVAVSDDHVKIGPKDDSGEFANVRRPRVLRFMSGEEVFELRGKPDPWSRLFVASEPAWQILGMSSQFSDQGTLRLNWNTH